MNKIEIEDLENVNGGAVLVDDSLPIVYLINDKNGSIADMALATLQQTEPLLERDAHYDVNFDRDYDDNFDFDFDFDVDFDD